MQTLSVCFPTFKKKLDLESCILKNPLSAVVLISRDDPLSLPFLNMRFLYSFGASVGGFRVRTNLECLSVLRVSRSIQIETSMPVSMSQSETMP